MGKFDGNEYLCLMLSFILTIIVCLFNVSYVKYHISNKFTQYYIQTTIDNLYKTPLYDIIIDNCTNKNNDILGYFGGTEEGYKYFKESMKEFGFKKCFILFIIPICTKIEEIPKTIYKTLKNKNICTSNEKGNYFDFYKLSIESDKTCDKDKKPCGYLDKYNRTLCLPKNSKCPINDIIYNNQPLYIKKNITYTSVQISKNEYLHYTNENINGYIIIGFLTPIIGFPCGSDNFQFENISVLDKFPTCNKNYSSQQSKYYFYKKLINIYSSDFLNEHNISSIKKIPEYDQMIKTNVSTFSIGYIGLSNNFLKKNPNMNSLNDLFYMKTKSYFSHLCYILNIIFGIYIFFLILFGICSNCTIIQTCRIKIIIIFISLIEFCGIIEILSGILINNLEGKFPEFYSDGLKKEKNNILGHGHFWSFLFLLLFNISFLKHLYKKNKDENLDNNDINETLNYNQFINEGGNPIVYIGNGNNNNENIERDIVTNNGPLVTSTIN